MSFLQKPLVVKKTGLGTIADCNSVSITNIGTANVTVTDGNDIDIELLPGEGFALSPTESGFYSGIEYDAETAGAEVLIVANLK